MKFRLAEGKKNMAEKIKKHIKKYCKIAIAASLVFSMVAIYATTSTTKGAQVTSRKDTLSDSRPSEVSNHAVSFTTNASDNIGEGETLVIDFGGASDVFNLGTLTLADIDFEVGGTDHNLVAAVGDCGAPANEFYVTIDSTTNDDVTFTRCASDGAVAGGSNIVVKFGSSADGGTSRIVNSTVGVRDITVAGTFQSTQVTSTMKVAIVGGVTVSATVSETLSVTVGTVASGSCTGDTGSPTVISTTSDTAVPFGALTDNAFKAACHTIEITTNAGSYSLTGQELTSMKYGSNIISDTVCGASACDETTAAAWTDADVYPGFGHSCENVTSTPCVTAYDWAVSKKYRQFACSGADADCNPSSGLESPVVIMSGSGAGTTQGKIHYKMGITGTEVAGEYNSTIVYITTPTF